MQEEKHNAEKLVECTSQKLNAFQFDTLTPKKHQFSSTKPTSINGNSKTGKIFSTKILSLYCSTFLLCMNKWGDYCNSRNIWFWIVCVCNPHSIQLDKKSKVLSLTSCGCINNINVFFNFYEYGSCYTGSHVIKSFLFAEL